MKSENLEAVQSAEADCELSGRVKPASQTQSCFGLFRRRERWGLSLRGWLGLFGLAALLAAFLLFGVYPFLAVADREPPSVYLVAEGWTPVSVLRGAQAEFSAGGYHEILVSGCIVYDEWAAVSGVTYADWGASKLRRMGMPKDLIQPVPCLVEKTDRTYSSALAVKRWLDEHGVHPKQINVVTEGSHARRSRLLFQKAFGPDIKVGIIAVADPRFDPDRWWRSSEGFREVIGEAVAYLYARFLFYPQNPEGQ